MNKLLKNILLLGTFILLAGCANQVQEDFLTRTAELIRHNHAEGNINFSDSEEVRYQFIFQRDKEIKKNIALHMEMIYFDQTLPLLNATIINEHILLDGDSFLETGSPFSYLQVSDISWGAWDQLKEDHQDRLILLKDEITVKDQDLQESNSAPVEKNTQIKKLRLFRKLFLKIDSEKFIETETEYTLKIEMEELINLFSPLLEQENTDAIKSLLSVWDVYFDNLSQENPKVELEITLDKERSFLIVKINLLNSSPLQESTESIEGRVDFSNRSGEVKTPSIEDIVTSGRLQNILTPLHDGHSLTGYSPSVFDDLLERTIEKRTNYELNERSATTLLDSYLTLLTEEQYRKLEKVLDIDTLENQFDDIPIWEDWNHLNDQEAYKFSQEGYPPERFKPFIESVKKYRKDQTKESAKKTLDKYRHVLNKKQFEELEKILDIATLPE